MLCTSGVNTHILYTLAFVTKAWNVLTCIRCMKWVCIWVWKECPAEFCALWKKGAGVHVTWLGELRQETLILAQELIAAHNNVEVERIYSIFAVWNHDANHKKKFLLKLSEVPQAWICIADKIPGFDPGQYHDFCQQDTTFNRNI